MIVMMKAAGSAFPAPPPRGNAPAPDPNAPADIQLALRLKVVNKLITEAEHLIGGFRELKATRTTVLLVEQNFHMARSLGDAVAVMDDGRIVHTGRMQDLAADEVLQARLLGLSLAVHQ